MAEAGSDTERVLAVLAGATRGEGDPDVEVARKVVSLLADNDALFVVLGDLVRDAFSD